MAPEVILEKPSDFKADIYSLGVMLYFLLCAEPPFDELYEDEQILAHRLSFGQPEWQTLDPSVMDLVSNMMIHDQKKRYSID